MHRLHMIESVEHVDLPAERFELAPVADERPRHVDDDVFPGWSVADLIVRTGEAQTWAVDPLERRPVIETRELLQDREAVAPTPAPPSVAIFSRAQPLCLFHVGSALARRVDPATSM